MQSNKFNIVVDMQFGSTGKGLACSYLGWQHDPVGMSTTAQPNSGHTAVWIDGNKFISKALPSGAALNKWLSRNTKILMGPSCAFHLDRIMAEIEECGLSLDDVLIHPRAGVVTDKHKQEEAEGRNSTKHLASTMQGGAACTCDKVMRKQDVRLARDYPELDAYICDRYWPDMMRELMSTGNGMILQEGSQGFSLDIHHGHSYPTCTSRQTTTIQMLADMGLNTDDMGTVYGVMRPYPIRVGNVYEDGKEKGNSGGWYPDQEELTWEQVRDMSGTPHDLTSNELTTVTKRLRRVATMSPIQLKQACMVNQVNYIFLNFANYIDYTITNKSHIGDMTPKVWQFVENVERITGVRVSHVGTGPQANHVIKLL